MLLGQRKCSSNSVIAGRRAMPGQSSWRSTCRRRRITRRGPSVSSLRAADLGGNGQSAPTQLPMPWL